MTIKFFKPVLLALLLVCAACPVKGEAAELNQPYSTWLWDTAAIVEKPDDVIQFLADKQADQLYLQIDQSLPAAVYQSFIEKANASGVKVQALDGAPKWATAKGEAAMLSFFSWVSSYQEQAAPAQQFSGIHLDIEPYLLPGWESNYKNTVVNYQTRMLQAASLSAKLQLPLGADIPFWFDEMMFSNKYGKESLAGWVIKNTDAVTIMAYRDTASGPNGMIELSRIEVELAARYGKQIQIAAETGATSEAAYITFYEEGTARMEEQLSLVRDAYSANSHVSLAVHHLQSWMDMKP
ncbi:amidase [Bacillus infantis]|uniref:amidase n=1 Tax=Bacillus infantis TaxID=324767 RepID=UPI0021559271|nr:amidase [Bacillus infantis]MCR6609290.1 amidase [Bacillus infantis]